MYVDSAVWLDWATRGTSVAGSDRSTTCETSSIKRSECWDSSIVATRRQTSLTGYTLFHWFSRSFTFFSSVDHVQNLRSLVERYDKEINDYRQRNENKKADIALHKKGLVAEEVNLVKSKSNHSFLSLFTRSKRSPIDYKDWHIPFDFLHHIYSLISLIC